MKRIRIWGYPTKGGGVDYFLYPELDIIQEFGVDDGNNSIDKKMSVDKFLASVESQYDYEQIVDKIEMTREENFLEREEVNEKLTKFSDRQIVAEVLDLLDITQLRQLLENLEKNYGIEKK